jgi:3-hydroxyisobutyrate dehydrogenase
MRVGWIGTGVMGRSMAGHLLASGHDVVLHSRTRALAEDLLARGAAWAASPREVAERADVVFTMVGFPADVEQVYVGEQGLLGAARPGQLFVDTTTTSPTQAHEIAAACEAAGAGFLDAPVSGGDVGARNATLSIMVGGHPTHFATALPLLEKLGKTIRLQGPNGAGQHTKMVNQILIATGMIGVCEALLYARKAGLDPLLVIESVGSGAAGSWSILNYGPRMVKRDFEPGFYVEHFLKDLGIALEECRRMGLSVPGLALADQLYRAVAAQGYGRKGTHSLLLALEHLNGMDAPVKNG